ncbi:hypothetical protein [Hymenobacter bucti]|uniref:GNAT family N-acetyltransferase n=1 Tax=Hymenobacter bucti TaxID=1844114 RepID=A0ABW4R1Y3_9BACT
MPVTPAPLSGKGFRVNWSRRDDYADIDRVMCYLTGENYDTCVGIDGLG